MSSDYPEKYATKSEEDMKKESDYYWTCSFCGKIRNEGTLSRCKNCDGVRKTA